MRNLILSLLIFLGFVANAQQTLDADVCTEFVHSKINELNIKIWNAVRSGSLTAYVNDSLSSKIDKEMIEEQITMEYTVMLPNPDNPDDPYDLIGVSVLYEFDSIAGYSGCLLAYESKIIDESIRLKLQAIAPIFRPMKKKGADFIRTPIFWVEVNEVKLYLSKEFEEFWPFLRLRTSMLNFDKIQFSPNYSLKKEKYLISQTVNPNLAFMDYSAIQDTLIGEYLSQLLIEKVDIYSDGLKFFRDAELKLEYTNIRKELRDSTGVMVPNPELPDDPYALVERMVYWGFDFSEMKNINVVKKDEIILEIFSSNKDIMGYTIKPKRLFVTYSSLIPYLQPYDRIVLESLLQEITK
jgi:hypothetical protein